MTIEYHMFFYMLAFRITKVSETDFFYYKVCLNNNFSSTECEQQSFLSNHTEFRSQHSDFLKICSYTGKPLTVLSILLFIYVLKNVNMFTLIISGLLTKILYSLSVVIVSLIDIDYRYIFYPVNLLVSFLGDNTIFYGSQVLYIKKNSKKDQVKLCNKMNTFNLSYNLGSTVGYMLSILLYFDLKDKKIESLNKEYFAVSFLMNVSFLVIALMFVIFNCIITYKKNKLEQSKNTYESYDNEEQETIQLKILDSPENEYQLISLNQNQTNTQVDVHETNDRLLKHYTSVNNLSVDLDSNINKEIIKSSFNEGCMFVYNKEKIIDDHEEERDNEKNLQYEKTLSLNTIEETSLALNNENEDQTELPKSGRLVLMFIILCMLSLHLLNRMENMFIHKLKKQKYNYTPFDQNVFILIKSLGGTLMMYFSPKFNFKNTDFILLIGIFSAIISRILFKLDFLFFGAPFFCGVPLILGYLQSKMIYLTQEKKKTLVWLSVYYNFIEIPFIKLFASVLEYNDEYVLYINLIGAFGIFILYILFKTLEVVFKK